MICPQCGYDMGNNGKCIRCGYENKDLAVVSERKENSEEPEVIDIDPCNVYLTHPYGYDDDYGTGYGAGGDPFAALFDDLFGDPISDLLGGLFGFDLRGDRRANMRGDEPKPKKDNVVEVRNVQVLDENDNPIARDETPEERAERAASDKHRKKFFKRKKK